MPVTINGTTGVVTPGATVGSITGMLKASSGVVSQAVDGTDYLAPGGAGTLTFATAQTISSGSTAVDFTGIPSWAKRITIIFQSVVNSGSSVPSEVRVGTSSGVVSSGYNSNAVYTYPTNNVSGLSSSTGFIISGSNNIGAYTGTMILTNISGNTWVENGVNGIFASTVANQTFGLIVLSGTLDRIRFTVPVGTLTSGTINISYEG